MPRPAERSRSLRRIKLKMPSGKFKTVYTKRKSKPARCAICKKPLHGTVRGLPFKIKRLARTKRRPERPYAGNLCSKCMRLVIKEKKLEGWGYGS